MRKDKAVSLAEKILNEHKAEEIETINVREKTPFADYYILATAGSVRQLKALVELVEDELEKAKIDIGHIEGKAESGWVLIDAHHIIINIFTKEERARVCLDDLLKK